MIQDIHGLKPLEIINEPLWPYFFYGLLGSLTAFGLFVIGLYLLGKRKK